MKKVLTAISLSFALTLFLSADSFSCGGGSHGSQGAASQGCGASACGAPKAQSCGESGQPQGCGGESHSGGQGASSHGGAGQGCSAGSAQPPDIMAGSASEDHALRLVASKCGRCHNSNVVFFSRKADWSTTIQRMEAHLARMRMPQFSAEEKTEIIDYLNTHLNTGGHTH